ncbi:MAG: hypothetical protein NZ602_14400 [Thermoguttaceae bacterium]|nr:hypothetical protein [Thermoguttaceae bacterium]MDW8036712.1 hypothetical protein [Thermoguttaceae bacterium]
MLRVVVSGRFLLLVGLVGWIGFGMSVVVAEAASLRRLVKVLSEGISEQSDEAAQRFGKLLDTIAQHSDETLSQVGKKLGRAQNADEAIARLLKIGVPISDELQMAIRNMDDVTRKALVGLLDETGTLLERWSKLGRSFDELLPAMEKAGPDLLYACRQMQSDEAFDTVVRGVREFGSQFVDFARKGDEQSVLQLSKHWDELKRAWEDPQFKPQLEDLFKNPVKYFDEFGKPTKHWDELLAQLRAVSQPTPPGGIWRKLRNGVVNVAKQAYGAGVGVVGWIWGMTKAVATGLAALLAPLLPIAGQALVALVVQVILLAVILLVIVFLLLPLAMKGINWILWKLLKWLAGRQGRLGQWAQQKIAQPGREVTPRTYIQRFKKMPVDVLKLGLLGQQRVGKTTFMVMLTKYLHRGVPGAILRPYRDDPDGKQFHQMEQEVATCGFTKEERKIALALTWPFFWEDVTAGEDRSLASRQPPSATNESFSSPPAASNRSNPLDAPLEEPELAGKLEMCLELVDYPGEWANQPEGRQRLSQALRQVDGLFVVIDPTDLENDVSAPRFRQQQEIIESMFAADRLDLGNSFLRSLAILITKRDAWTPELLQRLATSQGKPLDNNFHQMVQLAQKPTLRPAESQQLGQWLFELLFPGVYQSLLTRLQESQRPNRPWYQRFLPWFSLDTRPQLRIFAVSQLGQKLGAQVTAYRRQVQQWEASGRQGPKPQVLLDLDKADPQQLDILHAFRWMFNSIPEGWMWTAQRLDSDLCWYLPVVWKWLSSKGRVVDQTRQRFKGAPSVQRNMKVFQRHRRWALGLGIFGLVLFALFVAHWWRTQEINQFHQFVAQAQEVVSSRQQLASLDSLCSELREWEATVRLALHYKPQANYLLGLLESFQRMQPHLDIWKAEASSVEEKLEAAMGLLEEYGYLSAPPPTYREEIYQVWSDLTERLLEICQGLVALVRRETERFASKNQYEYSLIQKALRFLEILPQKQTEPYRMALMEIQHQLARQEADWLWNKASQQAEQLESNRDWPKAIKTLQNLYWPSQLSREDLFTYQHKKAEKLEKIAKIWFANLDSELEGLLTDGKLGEVDNLLEQFRDLVDWGKWPETIKALREKIADRFVEISVQEAAKQLSQSQFQSAEALLDRCRPYMYKCLLETARKWYQMKSELLRAQRNWQALIEHLFSMESTHRPEAWDKQLKQAWLEWTEEFQNRLQTQSDIDALWAQWKWAQTRRTDMPQELADKLPAWQVQLVERQLRHAFQQLDTLWKQKQSVKAHEVLDRFETQLTKLPPPLLREWLEWKIRLFEEEQRYLFAIQWINLLPQEVLEKLHKDTSWDPTGMRKKLLERAIQATQLKFRDTLKEDPAKAFAFLYQEVHSPSTPVEYREDLAIFADREISDRIRSAEEKITRLLQEKSNQQASQYLEDLRRELVGWSAEPKFKKFLDELAEKIGNATLVNILAQIETDLEQPKPNYEQIYKRLQNLLNQTTLKDAYKAKATALKETLLTQWEQADYETLRLSRENLDLDKLEAVLIRYTDKATPYWNQIPTSRWNAVIKLRKWFQQFQYLKTYEIIQVEGKGIPGATFWPPWDLDFDFAFKIEIGQQEYTPPGTYEIEGEGTVRLQKSLQVAWKPGIPVAINIWDEQVGKSGHYVGKISLTDRYSLIKLCLQGQKLDAENGNYPEYHWSETRFRFICKQIQEPPDLPAIQQSEASRSGGG